MSKETAREKQLDFLQKNCGATIKNLLFKHLGDDGRDFKANYADLLDLAEVNYWKSQVPTTVEMSTLMGSSDACFENSFGRLLSFGIEAEDILSPDLLKRYLAFVQKGQGADIYDALTRYLVAGYLYIGNCADDSVRQVVLDRIDTLHRFVTKSPLKYDIYVEPEGFSIPKAYQSKRLVNPVLYEDGEITLPLVHDLFIFSYAWDKFSAAYQRKIDAIIDYVSSTEYQDFDYGYGLVKSTKNKFHFMGWSAHMPWFNEALSTDYFKKGLIFRMPLFSKFENENIKAWRRRLSSIFEDFKVDDCLYGFSNDLLPEIKNSYFLNGRHTSLNENRRRKVGKTVESTFYVYLANI